MNNRRREALVIAFAIVVLAGLAACADDDLTVASGDVIGAWSGTTSQQRAVDFTVMSSGVGDGEFGYQMTGTCNFNTIHPINAADGMEIDRGKFTTGKTQIGSGAFVTISGEFTSSTTAKGTFLIQHAPCGDTLNITWTATKN
jgi:hypothetical protein